MLCNESLGNMWDNKELFKNEIKGNSVSDNCLQIANSCLKVASSCLKVADSCFQVAGSCPRPVSGFLHGASINCLPIFCWLNFSPIKIIAENLNFRERLLGAPSSYSCTYTTNRFWLCVLLFVLMNLSGKQVIELALALADAVLPVLSNV